MKHTARNKTTLAPGDHVIWTPKEVAELFHASKKTIYELLKAGRIEYIGPRRRPGSRRPYLIHVDEVTRLVNEGLPELPRSAA